MEENKDIKVEEQDRNEVHESSKKDKKEKKAVAELKEQLEAANAALAEKESALAKEKDDYIRLMAEFENFRRRSAKERLELIETAAEKIILELLPVVDDFERAIKALGESEANASAKQGTELIYNKLNNLLTAKGLKKIESTGLDFNTDEMSAIAKFTAPVPEQKGKVIDTVKCGYKLGDKVIRYADVIVGE